MNILREYFIHWSWEDSRVKRPSHPPKDPTIYGYIMGIIFLPISLPLLLPYFIIKYIDYIKEPNPYPYDEEINKRRSI